MPIYEFQCRACDASFERIVRMTADPPPCPICDATDVGKKVSRTTFHLKGSGWYATDYKKGAAAPPAETSTPSTSAKNSGSCCGGGSCSH